MTPAAPRTKLDVEGRLEGLRAGTVAAAGVGHKDHNALATRLWLRTRTPSTPPTASTAASTAAVSQWWEQSLGVDGRAGLQARRQSR